MSMILFRTKAQLIYHDTWLMAYADDEICDYYRKLAFMYSPTLRLNQPKHGAHITIISGRWETPPRKDMYWRKYDKIWVEIEYSLEVQNNELYYWLPVYCKMFEEIRVELGLAANNGELVIPAHMTIGNLKETV